MTEPTPPRDGAIPPDTLGIVAIVAGVLGLGGCIGTFVPYLGVLCMMGSMAISTMGVAVGVIGMSQRKTASLPAELSTGGAVINGVVLALWVLYWVLVIVAVVLLVLFGVGFTTMLILLDA